MKDCIKCGGKPVHVMRCEKYGMSHRYECGGCKQNTYRMTVKPQSSIAWNEVAQFYPNHSKSTAREIWERINTKH